MRTSSIKRCNKEEDSGENLLHRETATKVEVERTPISVLRLDPDDPRSRICPRTLTPCGPRPDLRRAGVRDLHACCECAGTAPSAAGGPLVEDQRHREHGGRLRPMQDDDLAAGWAASAAVFRWRPARLARAHPRFVRGVGSAACGSSGPRRACRAAEAQRIEGLVRRLGSSAQADVRLRLRATHAGLHPPRRPADGTTPAAARLPRRGGARRARRRRASPRRIAIADHVVDLGPARLRRGPSASRAPSRGWRGSGTQVTGRPSTTGPTLKGWSTCAPRAAGLEVRAPTRTTCGRSTSTSPWRALRGHRRRPRSGGWLVQRVVRGGAERVTGSTASADRGHGSGDRRPAPGCSDPIRKAFAKANGVEGRPCSARTPKGACPSLQRRRHHRTSTWVMRGVATTC